MVNLKYKMTKILSSEHYRKYLDLFWNGSNYYIDSHVNKDTLYQAQELIIEIIINMLILFDKSKSRRIKSSFIIKNFCLKL